MAPWELWTDGETSHCGVDVMSFARIDGKWLVANGMWTVEPESCAELRPAEPSSLRLWRLSLRRPPQATRGARIKTFEASVLTMAINHNAPVVAAAEARVAAPPSVVWAVQTDLRRWPDWNPDVATMDLGGPIVPGTTFRWKAGGTPIRSTIRDVEPERRIEWTGRAPLGIRAIHVWEFTPDGDGTRVRTMESFEGLLARVCAGVFRKRLAGALAKGVEALKDEAERRAGA